jgi:hypothetical protein
MVWFRTAVRKKGVSPLEGLRIGAKRTGLGAKGRPGREAGCSGGCERKKVVALRGEDESGWPTGKSTMLMVGLLEQENGALRGAVFFSVGPTPGSGASLPPRLAVGITPN